MLCKCIFYLTDVLTQAAPHMKLSKYSDYAMRVMIYLGARDGELSSIAEIAKTFSISQNHLMKIVQDLAASGFVETVRGRNGGIRLPRPPAEINLGALVRHTEGTLALVDCTGCRIAPACGLPSIFNEALAAFLAIFDKYTIADLVERRSEFQRLLAAAA